MSATIYVPRDTTSISLGADRVARAIAAEALRYGTDVRIVRNGSRGLFWLEPMVEVLTSEGRIAYGPVTPEDVVSLFEADFLHGGSHRLRLGVTDNHPWLARQERLTFRRVGVIDPLSLDDYRAQGGFTGLENALKMDGAQIVKAVTDSGLRGRGGAAFPAGIKWNTVLNAAGRSQVHRLQRRRRRFRHVLRSHADGRRPLPAGRGHGDRRPRGGAHRAATSTCVPNIRMRKRR